MAIGRESEVLLVSYQLRRPSRAHPTPNAVIHNQDLRSKPTTEASLSTHILAADVNPDSASESVA